MENFEQFKWGGQLHRKLKVEISFTGTLYDILLSSNAYCC